MDFLPLLKIIGLDIVLSGDNAVVIAMAARHLPAADQRRAIIFGCGAAVLLRILLATVASQALDLPYVKIVGAAALMYIAVQLIAENFEDDMNAQHRAARSLWHAVWIIVVADASMSLDNVLAVAAVANGNETLLAIGIAISIPIVIFASNILMKLMERYPWLVVCGGGLLGYVAGEMACNDDLFGTYLNHTFVPVLTAIVVVAVGMLIGAGRVGDCREP